MIKSCRKTLFLLFLFKISCQADIIYSSGPLYPSSCVDDSGTGTVSWTAPNNAQGSFDAIVSTANLNGNFSHYLVCSDYGFSLSTGTKLIGIKATVRKRKNCFLTCATHTNVDINAKLVKGGVIQSTNKAKSTDWTSSLADYDYGGSDDLWGDSNLGRLDINRSNFGFAFSSEDDGVPGTESIVDGISITAYYIYNNSIQWGDPDPNPGGIQFIGIDVK